MKNIAYAGPEVVPQMIDFFGIGKDVDELEVVVSPKGQVIGNRPKPAAKRSERHDCAKVGAKFEPIYVT